MTQNNRLLPLAAAILAAATVLMPAPASATLVKTASFDDKVANAAAIVLGQVTKQETRFDASHRWILTYTTFRVEKSFKGVPAQQEITVVTPGGKVGDIHQDTIGIPDFQKGDEHVVFIRNSSEGPTVLYWDQGAYGVMKNEKGDRIVAPVESEAVHVDTQRGKAIAAEEPRTIDEFASAVRSSEQRAAFNRMGMVRKQQDQQASHDSFLQRNKLLIALALLGAALATLQFFRR